MLECSDRRILIDCGMFQGSRELEENAEAFFDPSAIDYVLLTHAHLDHCGRLPLLAKRGFRGEVIATSATRELIRLVLIDAAHLQEEEAGRRAYHGRRRGENRAPPPLYTTLDALNSLDRLAERPNTSSRCSSRRDFVRRSSKPGIFSVLRASGSR
jgi:metallo-beta-lactamase family protein